VEKQGENEQMDGWVGEVDVKGGGGIGRCAGMKEKTPPPPNRVPFSRRKEEIPAFFRQCDIHTLRFTAQLHTTQAARGNGSHHPISLFTGAMTRHAEILVPGFSLQRWTFSMSKFNKISFFFTALVSKQRLLDRLCGLVLRVPGYRSTGPGSIPGTNRKKSSGSGTGSTQPREYN
jgi:hypothetical protein